MKVCRFHTADRTSRVGVLTEDLREVIDLSAAGVRSLTEVLESDNAPAVARAAASRSTVRLARETVVVLPPVERQEVWAAGVTYLRSKTARMEESDFSATAYDRVYAAPRPEIFFKALADKVVATGDTVGIRRDAKWNVPEPELALVLNSRRELVGYTVGNDMSSRDIEGENLLYLPQAKVYDRSCALGPWITLGATESGARGWKISIEIRRRKKVVFSGATEVSQIKRSFGELADYLFRSQRFPHGAVLLTGTGVVPNEDFTLADDDEIEITISGIGTLKNRVVTV